MTQIGQQYGKDENDGKHLEALVFEVLIMFPGIKKAVN